MSRKNVLLPVTIASNQSLNSSFTSPITVIQYADNIAYQINATAGATGTFAVQASLDYTVNSVTGKVINTGNWVSLTLSGTPSLTGSADNIIIDLNQLPYTAVRLAYTASSGSGTATILICSKETGG